MPSLDGRYRVLEWEIMEELQIPFIDDFVSHSKRNFIK